MLRIVLLFLLPFSIYGQVLEFSDFNNWEFRETGTEEWFSAIVPGSIHSDLLRLGKTPNPYLSCNEDSVQWIENRDWEYRCVFSLDRKYLKKRKLILQFEGLDTYAQVYLNDQKILTTNNMFREWEADINEWVKERNELRIVFFSTIKMALPEMAATPYNLPASNDAGELKVSPFVRKAPFQFGWDWAPRLVTAGIWRPLRIVSKKNIEIESLFVSQNVLTDERAEVDVQLDVFVDHAVESSIEVFLNDTLVIEEKVKLEAGGNGLVLPLTIEKPMRWWPNGWGDQHLYDLEVGVGKKKDKHFATTRFGLRTVELVNEKDSIGTSYFFRVNGIPIFMKGANYIPQNSLLNEVGDEDQERLLDDAVAANMNMIRVWGGGIYERDSFYDMCDEKGLLVWQDFMFACSMYPGHKDFRANVRSEIEDNVKRLKQHPSIALWCGNNEVNVAWFNWGWQAQEKYSSKDSTEIYNNYQSLFKELIPEVLELEDPNRDYVHTSPLSNWGTPENFNHSSMHYWGVWHGKDSFDKYAENVGRFNSEYGFQSFPDYSTIQDFVESDEDLHLESVAMKHRQKSYIGNALIKTHADRHFPEAKNFEDFVYLSQLTQALGIKTAIEEHRMDAPRCMGTLYWQLNDCWPAISWSGIDYYGNWKALHYAVQEAYKPIDIVSRDSDGVLKLHVVNDQSRTEAIETEIVLRKFDGLEIVTFSHSIAPDSKTLEIDCNPFLKNDKPEDVFLDLRFSTQEKNTHILVPPKDLNLLDPKLSITQSKQAGGDYRFTISAQTFVKNLALSANVSGHFDRNFFDLSPGELTYVTFYPSEEVDELQLKYTSLWHVMHRKE